MTHLDFTHITKSNFSLDKCADMYDDYLSEYHALPTEIWINQWQQNFMRSPFYGAASYWRGVPLVVK